MTTRTSLTARASPSGQSPAGGDALGAWCGAPLVTYHSSLVTAFLTATHPSSEITPNNSNQTRSQILIATVNLFLPPLSISAGRTRITTHESQLTNHGPSNRLSRPFENGLNPFNYRRVQFWNRPSNGHPQLGAAYLGFWKRGARKCASKRRRALELEEFIGHPAALGMYAAAALSAALWRAGGLSEAIHMALKAANDTSAKPPLQPNLKPEEQELARKREEQAALETEMAERELRSANFRAELGAFERQYLHFVGTCYA